MYTYLLFQIFGIIFIVVALVLFAYKFGLFQKVLKQFKRLPKLGLTILFIGVGFMIIGGQKYSLHFAMPPYLHSMAPDHMPPTLPIPSAIRFLLDSRHFERVKDIGANPDSVPDPVNRSTSQLVKLHLTTKEVISEIAPGIYNNYWTFDGQVPGPMLRVREGDTVETSITNDATSLHEHNIDLHATTGPGGGASLSMVKPGETKTFTWKALQPGLYIYHCATSNVSVHNSHGQYGLILVEPKEGLPKVDKEFYIVQGELYTQGGIGQKGLVLFDPQALLDNQPTYVTFNGKVHSSPIMKVKKGQTVRIYVGNGGVSLVSSFHIIGEIFDKVYIEGGLGNGAATNSNIQTTAVLPGGATIVEFKADVPGNYLLIDHALSRMNKGAWATLEVKGDPSPDIFRAN